MATKKDMRRAGLVVPFVEPEKDKSDTDMSSTMATTLPMMAIFTRNKFLGWTAVMFSLQSWLAETPAQRASSATPGYFSVGMSFMSLMVSYMPLLMPPPPHLRGGTETSAPPPAPPSSP